MITKPANFVRVLMVSCLFTAPLVNASDMHPLMTSKYWVNMGAFFAAMGLDDKPDLFNLEFGWRELSVDREFRCWTQLSVLPTGRRDSGKPVDRKPANAIQRATHLLDRLLVILCSRRSPQENRSFSAGIH